MKKELIDKFNNLSLENIIATSILVVLILIASTVLIKQSLFDLSRYGIVDQYGTKTQTGQKINLASIKTPGFTMEQKSSEYNRETLFEKIDGKAPLYLTAGFKKLVTRRYMKNDDKSLWFEVSLYDMSSLRNAFSVYSLQKRDNALYGAGTSYAYSTENTEIMVAGSYYIEIIGSQSQSELGRAMKDVAKKIQEQMGTPIPIPELHLFSSKYLVKGSEKYFINNAFGFKDFSDVYTAQYLFKGEKITVFISGPFTSKKLTSTIDGYRDFLLKQEGVIEKTKSSIPGLTEINVDGYHETFFVQGAFVAGVHESDSKVLALELSDLLQGILKKNIPGDKSREQK